MGTKIPQNTILPAPVNITHGGGILQVDIFPIFRNKFQFGVEFEEGRGFRGAEKRRRHGRGGTFEGGAGQDRRRLAGGEERRGMSGGGGAFSLGGRVRMKQAGSLQRVEERQVVESVR